MNPSAPLPTDAADSSRDERGRFTAGNRGGPGNPYARRVARPRSIIVECLTDEAMSAIVNQLIAVAKLGDLTAIKFLFQYALGKPAPVQVEPDMVDLQEIEMMKQAPTAEEFGAAATKHYPPDMLLNIMRITQLAAGQTVCDNLLDGLRLLDERDADEVQPSDPGADDFEPAPQAAPLPNGGCRGRRPDAAPSPNGEMRRPTESRPARSPNDNRPSSATGAPGGRGRRLDPQPTRR